MQITKTDDGFNIENFSDGELRSFSVVNRTRHVESWSPAAGVTLPIGIEILNSRGDDTNVWLTLEELDAMVMAMMLVREEVVK